MPFKFPYTNFQELNLDWIIKKVKDLSKQIETDSSIVSEYIDRLLVVESKADQAEQTATAADSTATGANNTANSALSLATQAKQTADLADLSTTLLGLKIGDLSDLFTTAKDTIVNAINEVWGIFHNATAVTNVTPAGTDPAVTYSNGVFTFDLPEGGDPDAVTQAELDAAIDGVEDTIDELSEELDNKADVIIDTASGDIATFPDGTATPLKSLVVNMKPVQNGTPSPGSIISITGQTGLEVYRTGFNVWDEEWEEGGYSSQTGAPTVQTNVIRSKNNNPISVKPNTDYYIGVFGTGSVYLFWYDINGNYIGSSGGYISSGVKTTPNNAYYLRFQCNPQYGHDYNNDISINYPSTDTEYHAYTGNSYPVTWADSVYGAALNVISGERFVTYGEYIFTGNEVWYASSTPNRFFMYLQGNVLYPMKIQPMTTDAEQNVFSSVFGQFVYKNADGVGYIVSTSETARQFVINTTAASTVEEISTLMSGTQLVYELETPIEATAITPTQINALSGYNNVWSDAGSVDVTYRADTKGYIDKLIAQVQALALGG